jgi:hypothetical protein
VSNYERSRRRQISLNLLEALSKERLFLSIVLTAAVGSAFGYYLGQGAMWIGFVFASYAAVANDSIQSLGTFIESNKNKKWWVLWLFVGGIFLVTILFSFIKFDGDVTYQRLLNDAGETKYPHPEQFSYFQLVAPLVLLILTRLRMPVSTTFLLLSVFSQDTSGISSIVSKSVSGYLLAFVLSFIVWIAGYKLIQRYFASRQTHPAWTIVQWVVSGALWSVWIMQDGANIAVFLPRKLDLTQFIIFAATIFLGLGLLFYLRGDKIQKVVSEKVRISDVRAATLIDFTYVLLLIYKLTISTVPMSTTWVFLGVIGGREIAINLARRKRGRTHKWKAMRVIGRDFSYALIGLFISVVMASAANPKIREEILQWFGSLV